MKQFAPIILIFFLISCKSESKVYKESGGTTDFVKPAVKKPAKPIPGVQKVDVNPSFPDSQCGQVTKRLMECHIEKLDENHGLSEELKKNMARAIKTRFDGNKQKYIDHCEKTISVLDKKAVDICLKMTCKEMDKCLQKTAGKTN